LEDPFRRKIARVLRIGLPDPDRLSTYGVFPLFQDLMANIFETKPDIDIGNGIS